MFIPTNGDIDKQAVFIAADQAGNVTADTPMREFSLNPKLQTMCRAVGLLEHNTIYSFRRTAITETQREKGTEFARELAGHKPNTGSIIAYDVEGLADVDITSLRAGDPEVLERSRKAIREAFKQASVSRIDPGQPRVMQSLQAQLEERVKDAMHSDEEYVAVERELDEMPPVLSSMLGIFPLEQVQCMFENYRIRLRSKGLEDALHQFDDLLRRRKALRQKLKAKHMSEQKEQMLTDHRKTLKVTKKKAVAPHGRGRQPAALQEAASMDTSTLDDGAEAALEALREEPASEEDEEDDDQVDEGAIEDSLLATREEPIH